MDDFQYGKMDDDRIRGFLVKFVPVHLSGFVVVCDIIGELHMAPVIIYSLNISASHRT